MTELNFLSCTRCGSVWHPRVKLPKKCARCMNPNWNKPKGKITRNRRSYGHISEKGYRRISINRKLRMEHDLVWEKVFGKIPNGFCIHHKDGNKLNNNIKNLEAMTISTHSKVHGGYIFLNHQWWKICRQCSRFLSLDNFYKTRYGTSCWCKTCAAEYKKELYRRNLRKRMIPNVI